MRASDADREVVRAVLTEAYSDGRLNREEYDERLGTLYGGRTLGDLPPLVADLVPPGSLATGNPAAAPALLPRTDPAELRARGVIKWRKDVEGAIGAFLIPGIICTMLWAAFGHGGFFWPMFPLLFLGINLVNTVVRRETAIQGEVARLEKRAAKEAHAREKRDAKKALRSAPADPGDPDEEREEDPGTATLPTALARLPP
jgi:hypothetical protein